MRGYKLKRVALIAIVLLTMLSVAAAAIYTVARPTEQAVQDQFEGYMYVVKEHIGFVAVFVPGSQTPEYISDMPVNLLPKADRDLLSQGIGVQSEQELSALLEDYLS